MLGFWFANIYGLEHPPDETWARKIDTWQRTSKKKEPVENADRVCGIVMPISTIDGCDEGHWGEVLAILSDAIESSGFKPNIVSNADDVGIIQKRIIQNLYENPIVICDVSGKNPNVMFELGLRLAFDKPTIIVKDDKTQYSFDTAPIEHLDYPRDLRFSKILDFKSSLVKKIQATYEASISDVNYTTFLKHFGEFKIAKIEEKEVSQQEFLTEEISDIKVSIARLSRDLRYSKMDSPAYKRRLGNGASTDICLEGYNEADVDQFLERALHHAGVSEAKMRNLGSHKHLYCEKRTDWPQPIEEIRADLINELNAFAGRRPRRPSSPPDVVN